ncbi:putative small nuclear ribonucleoprotein [Leptomonas pyrrhocoris]|uniref:Sm protein B n=1 Tax=Leptomonas pyrrhocoris TaxID=157538 RepID=A0A0N0DYL8_LEPPY|nr:putative small nuclear ribonucleoprotein [Leptomonas pyrrhocoris]XP_015662714.1 putative small nuclear ribonucleoprotein [Leptomonas pyrrhocoris]KPA84274.1 putative small nuclear ribonucleoprotein [Leptomonas pyrrhocoris]KPA84275.1 putative small nuclear ribonucleoprotein [Leptomonas pyrrhocoris]|eukprot:XP_015662713.1 putative small nuclear ribonucleoprotein [Leptomonas pyrrhocoris]
MGKYTMLHNINKVLCVLLDDGRSINGKLLVFDKHMNVVLGDATEERPRSKRAMEEGTPAPTRQLGLILLRGEHVVSVTVLKDSANGSGDAVNFSKAPKSAKAGAVKRKREE